MHRKLCLAFVAAVLALIGTVSYAGPIDGYQEVERGNCIKNCG